MRQFIFNEEREYSMIIDMWKALGFHFVIKRSPLYHREIVVYLLDTSSN